MPEVINKAGTEPRVIDPEPTTVTPPKRRRFFPDGFGRKFFIVLLIAAGWVFHLNMVTYFAFDRLEFAEAIAIAQTNSEELGKVAILVVLSYLGINALTKKNGNGP